MQALQISVFDKSVNIQCCWTAGEAFGWFSSVGQIIVIIVTKYVRVRVCLLSRGCVWEGVLMAVSCGRMAEKG